MSTVAKKIVVECLDCEQPIKLSFEPVVGQIITCRHCDAELEVISANPVEIDWPYFDNEDDDEEWEWDDDNDDDDDD